MRSEEVGIGSETSVFLLSLSAYEEVLSGVTGLTLVVSSETSLFSEDTDDCVISDRKPVQDFPVHSQAGFPALSGSVPERHRLK